MACLVLAACCSIAYAQDKPPAFDGARWIWFSKEPMPISQNFPGGVNCFRAAFELPQGQIQSAQLIIAADNLYSFYVNGRLGGESEASPDLWSQAKWFDVAAMLAAGRNVLAVEAVNTAPGPAGLVARLVVQLADGRQIEVCSGQDWKSTDQETADWQQNGFEDKGWRAAHVVGDFGIAPWGRINPKRPIIRAGEPLDEARKKKREAIEDHKAVARQGGVSGPLAAVEAKAPADYAWPEGVLFLSRDCSLYRPPTLTGTSLDSLTVTIFNPNHSRAFPEHDLPAPIKVGGRLMLQKPARPGVEPRVLLDAGRGGIGSPSVSFDGKWVYFPMACEGEAFFHIYRMSVEGGEPQRLTDGPFHDIDPAELADGRIVFTSTRAGTFEEYHNTPSRALFTMDSDGGGIRPLTSTFIFDNEPRVLADGRILFVRSDNFFDRGKVETLLHAVHPDGTAGQTEFGLDLGPEYGGRLRAFNCGSPAPLPDGRVAFVTGSSIAIGRPGSSERGVRHLRIAAGDVAATPDGRLLCTLASKTPVERTVGGQKRIFQEFGFGKIGIVDPDGSGNRAVVVYESSEPIHSPVALGARPRPPVLANHVDSSKAGEVGATGVFYCLDARFTKNTTAGWQHVRAIRVLAGKGLTRRSSHSYIVHAGSEVTELGTVPLAPDGSFAVEVPADTAIAFQAVDAEGRSELNEMSWIYVRPGETRGCVGCHQPRQASPAARPLAPLALRAKPIRLLGQGQPHRFRGNNPAVTGLMELQFDRFREVAGINRHIDAKEPLATGAQEVAALVGQLGGEDSGLKVSAAQRLAIFRDSAGAAALAGRLRDADCEVRLAAAVALATCGTRDSIRPLLDSLGDADPVVAQASAMALENLTGLREPFNAFASGDREVQAQRWREALAQPDWGRIERELCGRLKSADRDVVRRAAVALGHIGGEAGRLALREYIVRARENNPYPQWRQSHNGDGAMFNSLAEANPRTLQAAVRALGHLKDAGAVPLLAETLRRFGDPGPGNLFLAEAAAEALGRIATPAAETALIEAFAGLKEYPAYTSWYGDHGALMACHASPVHYFIIEALDAMGSTKAGPIVPYLIRAVPTDPDRALLPETDDYERLTGRVIRRSGCESAVVETCLAVLGDGQAKRAPEVEQALRATQGAWAGTPDAENRAAQVVSLACRDSNYEPRIRAAWERYRARPCDIQRLFDTGIPVVNRLPARHWVCFYLARSMGNLADGRSVGALIAGLKDSPNESAAGRPDPLGPGVLFIHNDLTPCWRAEAAWALGRIGDRRADGVLRQAIANLDNAPDTRCAAAEAMGWVGDAATAEALRKLAEGYPEVSTRRVMLEAASRLKAAPARE